MMHKAWSSIEEMPYCFSRSYLKLQGHTAKKIVDFDTNWAFPVCNSSLNSPMAMKCCTKLETAKERCPIVFQGHPSNFKVTRYKTSPILTQIGRFRTIGRSQLSNPSDLPCFHKFASKISDVFFQGQTLYWTYLTKGLSDWCETKSEVHRLDTGWTMWPWPLTSFMTLNLDFSRSNFKIALSQELLSDWCETKRKKMK